MCSLGALLDLLLHDQDVPVKTGSTKGLPFVLSLWSKHTSKAVRDIYRKHWNLYIV